MFENVCMLIGATVCLVVALALKAFIAFCIVLGAQVVLGQPTDMGIALAGAALSVVVDVVLMIRRAKA